MKRRTFLALSTATVGISACGHSRQTRDNETMASLVTTPSLAEGLDMLTDDQTVDTALQEIEALGAIEIEAILGDGSAISTRSILTPDKMAPLFPVPPITEELRASLLGRKYWALPEAERPNTTWPDARRSPDYLHFADFPLTAPKFTLSADVLQLLAARNAFDLRADDPVVVFGLRGCRMQIDANEAVWAPEHALIASTPTHLEKGCVIGLWRPADGQIALFKSSTVPSARYIFIALPQQGAGTSLLPTGLYNYARGDHLASKPKSIQRGALQMQDTYAVLRTAAEMVYDPFLATTAWTRGAGHNIHAAGRSHDFDSAGCQVVEGTYLKPERLKTTGAWDTFRKFAGTIDETGAAPPATAQRRFQYMLLTGLEAALAYHGGAAFEAAYRPLRFGSSGSRVAELQEALIANHGRAVESLKASGRFDIQTTFAALLENKFEMGDFGSHVVMN